MTVTVLSAGPGLSLQDLGRPGRLSLGVSRGGAMDPLALAEGAALLGQDPGLAALEMAGLGGSFRAETDLRLALTGAPMRTTVAGQPLTWGASHLWAKGTVLEIGPALSGSFGYLHVGGGFAGPRVLGARSADLKAGISRRLEPGDVLPVGADGGGPTGLHVAHEDRFSGGRLRLLPTAQTEDFPAETRARLAATVFSRDPRSNRQAVRLASEGHGFALEGGLTVLSEITQPGDIQVTGDGTPMILTAEAQTTGGYPRIATVLPADLPRAVQAPVGAELRLQWVTLEEGLEAERRAAAQRPVARPLTRDPRDMADLLNYGLVDGFITGMDDGEEGSPWR